MPDQRLDTLATFHPLPLALLRLWAMNQLQLEMVLTRSHSRWLQRFKRSSLKSRTTNASGW
eukprot:4564922-Amphidinium_carterae.1